MATEPSEKTQPTPEEALASIQHSLGQITQRLEAPQQQPSPDPFDIADKHATRYIRFTTFVFTAFALLAGGSLILNSAASRSAQDRAYADIATSVSARAQQAVDAQVPHEVNKAVGTAVPRILALAAETGVARELQAMRPTLVLTAAAIFASPTSTEPVTTGTQVPPHQPGQYAVIVASDTATTYLQSFAATLRDGGYNPEIYKIGDVFALTAGTFDSLDDLQQALITAKSSVTESAYFIDLSLSCKEWQFVNPGYFDCLVTPS